MTPSLFPDPRRARGDVVALGDRLEVEVLRDAYRHGIFPWPHDGGVLPWFSPRQRAVIVIDELRVNRTLRKQQRASALRFTIDVAFERVMRECSLAPRPGQDGTWISEEFIDAYTRLHRAGDAHSVEAWDGDELVGGLYGVDAGGVFTGESMFYRTAGASKLSILFLAEHVRTRGGSLIDCQVMTPHMEALGARHIPRARFLDLLEESQRAGATLFP